MDYELIAKQEFSARLNVMKKKYEDIKAQNLKLDMARGKPCSEQLNLSNDILECLGKNDYKAADGTDCRNYGGLDGLPEAKELFSKMIEVNPKNVIIGGNSSLNMMYDTIARAMQLGVAGGKEPWGKLPVVKFICPCPGYDRHFSICQILGIEMIVVPMKQDGPDMDEVEKLVKDDDAIKGMWCTPKYSNPDGITYSDEVVDRLASMETKANDFRIFWDNAYAIHHLTDKHDKLKNMMEACANAGNPDRVFIFSSSSKVTYPGSGVAIMAASDNNIALIKKQLAMQTIGPDKMNQLRHTRYFKTFENMQEHMKKQASILKPKFDMVLDILERELADKNIAFWNKPNGGYFISLFTLSGCAKAVVKMAAEAGLTLTPAGATYPYGKDPNDSNIRIAPTFPPLNELKKAIELLCVCVEIASIEKMLA